jgi:transcriptional regulator with XRE-family HTH domain
MNTNRTNQALTREMLEELRLSRDLTQQQMADSMGVTRSYYAQVACGAVSISKKFARKAFEAYPELAKLNNNEQVLNIVNNQEKPLEQGLLQEALSTNPDLAVVPAEHLEVVQANNELLEKIREDQKRELEIKRKQSSMLGEMVEAIQGLDTVVQARVRDIIDERTRTIIAMSNHHIHTQAQIMITALEGIINMLDAGLNNTAVFRKQLETVRQQLKEMAVFKQ